MDIATLTFTINEGALIFVKLIVLFSLLMYLSFSIVVIRQAQLMTRTVTGELDRVIQVLSWVLFVISAGIFIVALIIL